VEVEERKREKRRGGGKMKKVFQPPDEENISTPRLSLSVLPSPKPQFLHTLTRC